MEMSSSDDRGVLLELYMATNGPAWRSNEGWNTGASISCWYGVTVNKDGRVIMLNLSLNGLQGAIPESFGQLSELTHLYLHYNQLSGAIPESLGQLSNLSHMYLHCNQISGAIPESLGQMSNLKHLYLQYNEISGVIPESFGLLSNLTHLFLLRNQLSGTIPKSLGQLLNLTHLHLHCNQLSGAIPESLGNLSSLNYLCLYGNQLSGAIPESLGRLSGLIQLFLHSNKLTGAIPDSLGKLSNLRNLRLANNKLSGTIPESLGHMSKLTCLYLHSNKLSGIIPESFGNLSNLQNLCLAKNKLSGAIPESLGRLSKLVNLYLQCNELSGPIPESLGHMSSLGFLRFAHNQLSGAIPDSLGHLSNLTHLYLHNNQLVGVIPESFGQLLNLTCLTLYSNKLRGIIPESLGQLSSLMYMSLHSNNFNGAIPDSLGHLSMLVHLYLHCNNLRGAIPNSLGQMSNLKHMFLHSNQLSDIIPESLGQLFNLTHLYLHCNQLTGTIPESFGQLSNLTYLSLHSNHLTGVIPESLGYLSRLFDLRLANNHLNGAIPESLGKLPNLAYLSLFNNSLTGPIPESLGNLINPKSLLLARHPLSDDVSAEQQDPSTKAEAVQDPAGSTVQNISTISETIKKGEINLKEHPRSPKHAQKEDFAGDQSGEMRFPDHTNKQTTSGEAIKSSELDKNKAILAERLGTQEAVFLNSSFGVELILEKNSLEKDVNKEVSVNPELRFITCNRERDKSRTHDELLAWGLQDNVCGNVDGDEDLLLMSIVHGPSEAKFEDDKPARLRFLVGYLKDIKSEIQGESEDVPTDDMVVANLRETYEPLISADGQNWRMLKPFDAIFKNNDGATEVWLEARIYHFSVGSIGKVLRKHSKHNAFKFFEGRIPWRMRFFGHRQDVMLGNATEDDLVYYACKKGYIVTHGERREGECGGMGARIVAGYEHITSFENHSIDHNVMKHEVESKTYQTVEMFKDGKAVHDQMMFAVFLRKAPNLIFLEKRLLSKGKMYVVLPKMIAKWRDGEEPTVDKLLDSKATLTMVKTFLQEH